MTAHDPPAPRLLAPPRPRASALVELRAIVRPHRRHAARSSRAARRITIAAELGDDPLLVSADEHQIQQALVNLS